MKTKVLRKRPLIPGHRDAFGLTRGLSNAGLGGTGEFSIIEAHSNDKRLGSFIRSLVSSSITVRLIPV